MENLKQSYLDRYDLFVFDLDGTLADTRADLTDSVNEALGQLGAPPLDIETVTSYVGNGAGVLVKRVLGPLATPENLDRVLESFLASYREGCTRRTTLYPGVLETLEGMADRPLAVLTNKPVYHSQKILAALGVETFFKVVLGGDSLPTKKPDPAGLHAVLKELGHPPHRTLMVGDSSTDILTARAAGVAVAFVTYGFAPEACHSHPPDHILCDLRDLLSAPSNET